MIKKTNRIYLSPPHVTGREIKYINRALDTNWVAPAGSNIYEFEKAICDYTGAKYSLALSSGTSAIHLALRYLGVGEGDYVFCSSLTFVGSCNPIIYQNAVPLFVDSEPESWNMSSEALEKALHWSIKKNKKPKAVIVVNLYGQSADMNRIIDICNHYGVPVVEDSAESLGASYNDKMSGTFGKFGIFSFNGNKIITTSGGGMLVSDDKDAIEKARFWATQARDKALHYEHSELGYNYRLSNICAGIGLGQLAELDKRISQKKTIFKKYMDAFADIDEIEMMPIASYGQPNFWLSVITIDKSSMVKPGDIMLELEKNNIECRPVWKPMHLQPYYRNCNFYNFFERGISVSEDIFKRGLCLPSGTKMTEMELGGICDTIRSFFE